MTMKFSIIKCTESTSPKFIVGNLYLLSHDAEDDNALDEQGNAYGLTAQLSHGTSHGIFKFALYCKHDEVGAMLITNLLGGDLVIWGSKVQRVDYTLKTSTRTEVYLIDQLGVKTTITKPNTQGMMVFSEYE